MCKNLKVEIDRQDFGRTIPMAIYFFDGPKTVALTPTWQEVGELETLPHFEFRSRDELQDFLRPFLKLAEELGMLGKDASRLKGELEATKYHLEDMRILAGVAPYKETP